MSKKYRIIIDGNGEYFYARIHRDGSAEEIGYVYCNREGLWTAWHGKPLWGFFPNHTSRVLLTQEQARAWMKKELNLSDPDMPALVEQENPAPTYPSNVPRGTKPA